MEGREGGREGEDGDLPDMKRNLAAKGWDRERAKEARRRGRDGEGDGRNIPGECLNSTSPGGKTWDHLGREGSRRGERRG